jgi:hypothetical protein
MPYWVVIQPAVRMHQVGGVWQGTLAERRQP